MSRFDLYNNKKHCKLILFLPFHLFRHFKTQTGNYTLSPPKLFHVIVSMSINESFKTHSLCIQF